VPDAFSLAHSRADTHTGRDADATGPDPYPAALPHADAQKDLTIGGDRPRVSAIVACVDDAGRILLIRQTAGPFAGAWLLPGGNVERDEPLEDASRRELLEETGYRVDDLRPAARYDVRSVPAGGFHFLVHLFRGGAVSGTPRPERGSEIRWADPSATDLHPSLALALVDLGLIKRDRAAIARDHAKIGVEMRRLS
jgi:8-oxo-dGTP diphosphatase